MWPFSRGDHAPCGPLLAVATSLAPLLSRGGFSNSRREAHEEGEEDERADADDDYGDRDESDEANGDISGFKVFRVQRFRSSKFRGSGRLATEDR